jgi:hypothetical protein
VTQKIRSGISLGLGDSPLYFGVFGLVQIEHGRLVLAWPAPLTEACRSFPLSVCARYSTSPTRTGSVTNA